METVFVNDAPLLDCGRYISGLKLTAAEQKKIDAASKRIASLHALALPYRPRGRDVVNDCAHAVTTNPCPETMAALADAVIRQDRASDIHAAAKRALAAPINEAIDTLKPIALRCLDSIIDAMKADTEAHAKAVAGSPFAGDTDSGLIARRMARTIDTFEGDRKRIETEHAALHYLCQWDLALDPFERMLIEGPEDDSGIDEDFH